MPYESKIPATLKTFAKKYKLKVKAVKQYYQGVATNTFTYILIIGYDGNNQRAIADIRETKG